MDIQENILGFLDYFSGLQFSPRTKEMAIDGQMYSITIARMEEECQNSEYLTKIRTCITVCKDGKKLIFEKNIARGIESFDEYFVREEIADDKIVCRHIRSTGEMDGPYCKVENEDQLDVRIYPTYENLSLVLLSGVEFYKQNSVLTGSVKGKNYLFDYEEKKYFIEGEEYAEMMEISSTIGGKEEIAEGLHMLHLADQYLNTNIDCWTHYSEKEIAELEQQLLSMTDDIYVDHITQLDLAEASKQNIKK